MKTILFSVALISIAFIGMGISIFFRKGGKFPETEIGHNKYMKRLGITCVKCEESKKMKKIFLRQKLIIKPSELRLDINKPANF
jgi:hypothetical protein